MLFREQISLIAIGTTPNGIGDAVEAEVKTTVFADKQSVKRNEFYQAAATGLRPEVTFVLRTIDYTNQQRIEWNLAKYKVIRAYERDDELTELVCQSVTNGVI